MKHRILIVEDELELQQNLKEILEFNDFVVFAVSDVESALELLDDESVDLVVSDVMMPGIHGYDFLKMIRASGKFVNLPFIFLTAKISKDDVRFGMEGGADDYLTKPVSAMTLIKAINTSLLKSSERKKWADSIAELAVQNEQKIKYHELKTPLFGVLMILETLQSGLEYNSLEENLSLIKYAYESTLRMDKSLNKLSRYHEVFQNIQVDGEFLSLKDSLLSSFENHLKLIDIELKSDINIFFNKKDIQFIFEEILENYLKFKYDDNRLVVTQESSKIFFKNKQKYISKNFVIEPEPFFQLERERNEQQGLGLGLFLISKYCDRNSCFCKCYINDQLNFIIELDFSN